MTIVAVVPIFMSAGTAILPTILAVAASIGALVLNPRELLGLCRRRPAAVGGATGAIATVLAVMAWWLTAGAPARAVGRPRPRAATRYDWAKVAEDIIAQERAGQLPTPLFEDTHSDATSKPAASAVDAASASEGEQDARPPEDGLKVLWRFRPEDTMFLSVPAIGGKRVFTAGCQVDLGSYTGLLACLDLETGQPLWQITQIRDDLLRPFFSSPALSGDGRYLVIGQGLHDDRDCSLLCFETATGRLHWEVKTPLHIESSPAVFGDMAVVGAGATEGPGGRAVGDPGFVLAVRISDGKELWRQAVNDPESSPAIDESGTVYIGSGLNGNAVVAMRSVSDEELRGQKLERVIWRTPVGQPALSPIALAGDLVIAGGGNGDVVHSGRNAQGLVTAFDCKTGRIVWQKAFEDAVLGRIACRDGMLVCPVRTGEVAALAVKDGQVLWRTHISGSAPVLAGCAFAGGRIFAVSSDGYLAVLDATDGNVLKKLYVNDQAKPGSGLTLCTPQIVGGRIVVGSETGGLRCLAGAGNAE